MIMTEQEYQRMKRRKALFSGLCEWWEVIAAWTVFLFAVLYFGIK